MDIEKIYAYQREFTKARDWEPYHTPKNLTMALIGEAAELSEIFQWVTPEDSLSIMEDPKKAEAIRHEIADVFYYLCRLTDRLGVDLETAFWEKQKLNAEKYPVDKAKGNPKKYTEWT